MKSKFDKFFLLSWKKVFVLIILGFLFIILHNLFYAVFNFEEAVFFVLVIFVVPFYFLCCVVYTIFKKIKGVKK